MAKRKNRSNAACLALRRVVCHRVDRSRRARDIVHRNGLHFAFGAGLVISTWVLHDARKRGRQFFYDYGMFVFFCWPIVAPVSLFQTRGVRAFITLLCFIGIWALVGISVGVAIVFREVLHAEPSCAHYSIGTLRKNDVCALISKITHSCKRNRG
jgi:hypothetical protein